MSDVSGTEQQNIQSANENSALQSKGSRLQSSEINKIHYTGMIGDLYAIWIKNIFLNVVTLGFYRFWGKTHLRQYVAGCFNLDGDTFEYLGTGKQMFVGFMKIMPLALLLFIPFIAAAFYSEDNMPGILSLLTFISLIAVAYLIPVARYMALRYRVSRLSWRGIRGYMGGSALEYGKKALWWNFLNIITLALMKPKFDMAKARFKIENIYAGNIKADFEGSHAALWKKYFISWGIMAYFLVVAILLFAIPIVFSMKNDAMPNMFLIFLSIIVLIIGAPLAKSYYRAAFLNECLNQIRFGQLSLQADITFSALMKLQVINMLLLVCTMGLAKPLTLHRRLIFIQTHIRIIGDLNSQEILQAKNQKPSFAEGLDDALDIDSGLIG
jgi:uncharacterized membrane protein YjgN (DUF898 family)